MKAVNSSGGRILVMLFVLILGLTFDRVGVPYAKEMVLTTLATLLAVVSGQRRDAQ